MIRKLYSRISNRILRWRWRRLYYRLFWYYAQRTHDANEAGYQAKNAFRWLTLKEWVDWADQNLPGGYQLTTEKE